jgi:hypothetical protein
VKRLLYILFLCWASLNVSAQEDSISTKIEKQHFYEHGIVGKLYNFVKTFSQIDTNYIEPQRYNFTVMVQNTNTYEQYTFRSNEGTSVAFSPKPSLKIGPYFGWRFVFLGYTFDIKHINIKAKQELDLSLYTSQIGFDIYYRKTGNEYKIRQMYVEHKNELKEMRDMSFDGLKGSIKGFNIYYILNHKKFSYPAAFSQSTIQRHSAGSPIVGIGYARQALDVDWNKLETMVKERCGDDAYAKMDSSLLSGKVYYHDTSIYGGYGYNWVFAKNWLFDASLSAGLSYKRTTGDMQHKRFTLRDFSFKNVNVDGTGRFAIVWNDMRWYVGTSAIFHTYYYKKGPFSTNTTFGCVNIYVGFNFGRQ